MSTILVAVILVSFIAAVVLALIWVNNRDRKKATLNLLNKFSDKAMENNLSISSQEVLDNTLIGVDGVQRKLLIVKKIGTDRYDSHLIDLREVKSCRKKSVYKSANLAGGKKSGIGNHVEKVMLEFEYTDGGTLPKLISFGSLDNHILTMSELDEKAKKWEGMIAKLLSNEFKKIA